MTKIRVSGPELAPRAARQPRRGADGGRGGGGGGRRNARGPAGGRRLPGLGRRRSVLAISALTTLSRKARPWPTLLVARALPPSLPLRPGGSRRAGCARWLEPRARRRRRRARRLLSVYDDRGRETRAQRRPHRGGLPPAGLRDPERPLPRDRLRSAGIDLARRALQAAGLSPADIELVVSVSCTGFMIPAVDAYVADALGLGPRLVRLPITESGCAGGVVGLARAADYLTAPSRARRPRARARALEPDLPALGPLGHERRLDRDLRRRGRRGRARRRPSTRAPSAPRRACASGRGEPLLPRHHAPHGLPSSATPASRSCSTAARALRAPRGGPARRRLPGAARPDAARTSSRWILHPGGRRIIEVMAERLGLGPRDLAATEAVLSEHGNMSSVTVLFVLDELAALRARPRRASAGVLGRLRAGLRRRARAPGVPLSGAVGTSTSRRTARTEPELLDAGCPRARRPKPRRPPLREPLAGRRAAACCARWRRYLRPPRPRLLDVGCGSADVPASWLRAGAPRLSLAVGLDLKLAAPARGARASVGRVVGRRPRSSPSRRGQLRRRDRLALPPPLRRARAARRPARALRPRPARARRQRPAPRARALPLRPRRLPAALQDSRVSVHDGLALHPPRLPRRELRARLRRPPASPRVAIRRVLPLSAGRGRADVGLAGSRIERAP